MKARIRGVLFDVDETLVYYENYNHRVWYENWVKPELEKRGINLDYETYRKTVTGELPRSYVEKMGIDHVEFWRLVDVVNLRYRKEMAKEGRIKAFPDVAALNELRKLGLKMGAVSNASQECTEFVLRLLGLRKYFDLVQGKDYRNLNGVKPRPYLIFLALERLNLRPEKVLLVGDSAHDVVAGKKAGVITVNITRFQKVKGADYYIKNLWELLDLIKTINKR